MKPLQGIVSNGAHEFLLILEESHPDRLFLCGVVLLLKNICMESLTELGPDL